MGAAAFLMAEFLQVGYATVVLAAVLPALLYYFAIFLYVDLHAAATGLGLPEEVEVRPLRAVLADGWQFVLPFAVLIGTLFFLNWRPERSALAAAGTLAALALVVPYRGERASARALLGALPGTGRAVVEIVAIAGAAGMVIGVLNISGLSFSLTLELVQMAEGRLIVLLLVAAVVSVVLGMGMPTVGVYVLLASLIGPALVQAGIDKVAAHMFLLYFGMLSMITPPVALASFTAASMAGAPPMRTGWQALQIGWVAYLLPFVIVLEPGLVMRAEPADVIWTLAGAAAGVVFATAARLGHFAGPLAGWRRTALPLAAVVAILPVHELPAAGHGATAGAIAAGLALLWPGPGDRAPAGPPRRR
jgi:TRAP transporter 4TM/12TM fusion protein